MNARVTIVQVLPGKVDEAVDLYRDSVVPAAKQQKRYKGGYLLTDHNTGKGISITLWETEADMMTGENSGYYQQQRAKFKDVFDAPLVREAYDVSVLASTGAVARQSPTPKQWLVSDHYYLRNR